MWLDLLVSALFGILEGVTEWLPISSTGHLILLSRVVKFPARDAFFSLFEVVIQLAAILAVLLYYRERLNPLSAKKTAAERSATWRLWGLVLLATLPAAILGLLLGDLLECYLYRIPVVAAALILYGVAFLLLERWRTRHPLSARTPLPGKRQALWIGCFQALALIPGTSRSGSTVIGGLCTGLTREGAAEFSCAYISAPDIKRNNVYTLVSGGYIADADRYGFAMNVPAPIGAEPLAIVTAD